MTTEIKNKIVWCNVGGYTLQFEQGTTVEDVEYPGQDADKKWMASSFTYTGATITIIRIDLYCRKIGTPTGYNARIHLYAASGQLPTGSSLGSSSWRLLTSLQTSSQWEAFYDISVSLTNGNYYCVVVETDYTDSTNKMGWDTDFISDATVSKDDNGITPFTSISTTYTGFFRLYS